MSSHESPVRRRPVRRQQPPIRELPENIPSVAFDINLGKKYKYVDFDYDSFGNLAEKIGLSSETVSNLSITVSPDIAGGGDGVYYSDQDSPDKKIIGLQPGKNINGVFKHELRHAYDDQNNQLGNRTRYAIGALSVRLSSINMPVAFSSIAAKFLDIPGSERISDYSSQSALMLGVAALWGYQLHPSERRARKAEKLRHPDVITLKKS